MENVIYGQFVCAKSLIQTRPTWAQLSYWGLLPGSFFRGETLETARRFNGVRAGIRKRNCDVGNSVNF